LVWVLVLLVQLVPWVPGLLVLCPWLLLLLRPCC
jgi:hypothetical protein